MYVLWILLCWTVGWGDSKENKRPLYEEGLKTAWIIANLFEFLLPADNQVLPDLTITEVLYVPPYKRDVKKIRTATQRTPVRIGYLFRGVTGNSTNLFTKGKWLCTIFIDERLYDGEYYYLYPWNNLIHCEVDDDGEGENGGPVSHIPYSNGAPPTPPVKHGRPPSCGECKDSSYWQG